MAGASKPVDVSTKRQRIAELARQSPTMGFTSLAYFIDIDWLSEAYRLTRKDGAVGVDGQSGEDYAANLESNLKSLLETGQVAMMPNPESHSKGNTMTTANTYLAVFLGSKTSKSMKAWMALPEAERKAKEQEGMAGWKEWAKKHQSVIVGMGGPLGNTKKVSKTGIADVANQMGAYTVVRADSHEAAAKLFENHPHFAIFPGEAVEVMPVMPIPGG